MNENILNMEPSMKLFIIPWSQQRIPSRLQPSGLARPDRRILDGVTIVPWSKGRLLMYDVACTDTSATFYLKATTGMDRCCTTTCREPENF